jgi:3-oxoacyl-[acyl-carrier protein] reductase
VDKPLNGKVALVTGAARGVGKALAIELARLGADVIVTARTAVARGDDLAGTIGETAAAIESEGSRALAVQADLLVPGDVSRLIDTALTQFPRIDILVNNAADTGDNVFRGFWDTSPESWAAQMQLNVNVMYELMKAFAPGMKEHGGGIIVNIGSAREAAEGLHPAGAVPLGATYPTTKVAIFAMTTFVAQELAKDNIVAVTLTPGPALTESFKHNSAKFGFDQAFATPVELPVRALREVVTSPDPMQYAATFIDSLSFAGDLGS